MLAEVYASGCVEGGVGQGRSETSNVGVEGLESSGHGPIAEEEFRKQSAPSKGANRPGRARAGMEAGGLPSPCFPSILGHKKASRKFRPHALVSLTP